MNPNRLLKNSQRGFYTPPVDDGKSTFVMLGGRGNGRTFAYYWRFFRKQYAKEKANGRTNHTSINHAYINCIIFLLDRI